MTKIFPSLERGKTTQGQETQRVAIKMNPKRLTLRHSIIKMPSFKDTERILKAAREKQEVTYKRAPIDQQLISQQKHYKPGGNGKKYSK